MENEFVFISNPRCYLRKSWRGRGEIWCRRQRCLSLGSLFHKQTSQSYLSPAGYPLGVGSDVVDGCHCSTPFHILKRQLSKANKQSSCHSALKHHSVMSSLFWLVSMFYSLTQQWSELNVCTDMKAFLDIIFIGLEAGYFSSSEVLDVEEFALITSEGDSDCESRRDELIHTRLTQTNRGCLREQSEGRKQRDGGVFRWGGLKNKFKK